MKPADTTDLLDKDVGRILIVDDLPNWRETLTEVLVTDGHTVSSVAEPSQAMELLSRYPVDVAVLDLRLRDQDIFDVRGLRLLEEIRAKSPRTCVVMVTGFPSERLLDKIAHEYKIDAFWLKNPTEDYFDIEVFRQEIRSLVEKSRKSSK